MGIVCINNGYANTKVKSLSGEYIFESKTRNMVDRYDTNVVNVDGTSLVVGDGSLDIELDKTISTTQKACLKLGLTKSNESNCICLISSMPANSYLNAKARSDYNAMLNLLPGVIKSYVYMEGMAAVLSDISWYRNKLVCLLDIGGLTINAMLIDNGKLVQNTAFSMQLGTIILENRIKKAIEQTELENIPDYQIKYLVAKPQVNLVVQEYIQEIKQTLKKAQYPSDVQIRFTGGGSISYHEVLSKAFKNSYTSNDAIWENVRGLWMLGKVVNK